MAGRTSTTRAPPHRRDVGCWFPISLLLVPVVAGVLSPTNAEWLPIASFAAIVLLRVLYEVCLDALERDRSKGGWLSRLTARPYWWSSALKSWVATAATSVAATIKRPRDPETLVLVVGIALLTPAILFPPWVFHRARMSSTTVGAGRSFLLNPPRDPQNDGAAARVDAPQLALELASVGMLTVAALLVVRRKK